MSALSPQQLASVIENAVRSNIQRPIHVQSAPGMGKTSIPKQVAEKMGIGCSIFAASFTASDDLAIPMITNGEVKFGVNGKMLPLQEKIDGEWQDIAGTEDQGILIIDELPQGSADIQKKMGTLIQERRIHNYRLKPGWFIVTTGNRKQDRAGANRMLTHLTDRLTVVEMNTDLKCFSEWYRAQPDYSAEGLAFLRYMSNRGTCILSKFDPDQDICPSPRSWAEGAFKWVGRVAPAIEMQMIAGCVGEGAAAEFTGFLRTYRSLPDIDAIIADPKGYPVPADTSVKYALAGMIGSRMTAATIDALLDFTVRMEPEYEVVALMDALNRKDSDVGGTPAFSNWANTRGSACL